MPIADVCARNNGLCIPWTDNLAAWEYPGIGRSLFFLFLQVIIFFLLLFFFESGTFKVTDIPLKHIEAKTEWPTFSRRHFQTHFLEWNYMNFDEDFNEVCS